METLGYGTHLTVDVSQADLSEFASPVEALSLLRQLALAIEGCTDGLLEVPLSAADGSSAAILCSESQLFMHVFPDRSTASLRIFTRLDSALAAVVETIRKTLRTGRTDSHISMVSRLVPNDAEVVGKVLAGDRGYTLARLEAISSGP